MRPSDRRRNQERHIAIATLAGWRFEPVDHLPAAEVGGWRLKGPKGAFFGYFHTIPQAAHYAVALMKQMDWPSAPDGAMAGGIWPDPLPPR